MLDAHATNTQGSRFFAAHKMSSGDL